MELVFSLVKCVSVILFFALPYICRTGASSSCFHLHTLSLFDHDLSWDASHFSPVLSFNLMPVLTCAARKMFPKRKLDESRSGSETQKEEAAEAKEERGQQNKRPRMEPEADAAGTASLQESDCRAQISGRMQSLPEPVKNVLILHKHIGYMVIREQLIKYLFKSWWLYCEF